MMDILSIQVNGIMRAKMDIIIIIAIDVIIVRVLKVLFI